MIVPNRSMWTRGFREARPEGRRRRVTESVGHPGMGRLVDGDGEEDDEGLNEYESDIHGLKTISYSISGDP